MGRSVSVPREAVKVFYVDLTVDDDDDALEYLVEDLQYNVLSGFKSVTTADFWVGREDKAIAQNGLVVFGVSEYCGLASVWAVPNGATFSEVALAEHWLNTIWPSVEKAFPHRLELMGRFSNGEAVYRRVNATEGALA